MVSPLVEPTSVTIASASNDRAISSSKRRFASGGAARITISASRTAFVASPSNESIAPRSFACFSGPR